MGSNLKPKYLRRVSKKIFCKKYSSGGSLVKTVNKCDSQGIVGSAIFDILALYIRIYFNNKHGLIVEKFLV